MRKTDKLCLSHHTHSSSVCCIPPLAIYHTPAPRQQEAQDFLRDHGSHLSFAGPHLEKQKHSTATKSSHWAACSSSRPDLQADFFLAYGNVLALISSWFLSHFLTKVLKKGIRRNSSSAMNDILTSVEEMNMKMDFRNSSSTYLVHSLLQKIRVQVRMLKKKFKFSTCRSQTQTIRLTLHP